MPEKQGPIELTRAQRKVLSDLALFSEHNNDRLEAVVSHAFLIETTGLPNSTVHDALERLNDLGLILTIGGDRVRPGRYIVYPHALELTVRLRAPKTRAARA